jgi:hypothetical protein
MGGLDTNFHKNLGNEFEMSGQNLTQGFKETGNTFNTGNTIT